MKELQIFNFKGNDVREITDQKGDPWFIAKDVSDVLGFRDPYTATRSLDDDEKLLHTLGVGGQNRETTLINETGLYSLILKSKKPEAKAFKRWITHDVLPSIRKTGSFGKEKPIQLTATLIRELRLAEKQNAIKTVQFVHHIAGVPQEKRTASIQMDLFEKPSMSKDQIAEGFRQIGNFLNSQGERGEV